MGKDSGVLKWQSGVFEEVKPGVVGHLLNLGVVGVSVKQENR